MPNSLNCTDFCFQRSSATTVCFETIDAIYKTLKERFEQPSFIVFSNVEQLLLESINDQSYQKEHDNFVLIYADDVEAMAFPSELLISRTMFESLKPVYFGDIVEKFKTVPPQQRVIINNGITITKIVLTTGATSASPERSFPLER